MKKYRFVAGTRVIIGSALAVGDAPVPQTQEADLVNFLKILTDEFTRPDPVNSP